MKINAIDNRMYSSARVGSAKKASNASNVNLNNANSGINRTVISFGSAAVSKNPLSITHFAAEMPDWMRIGGVSTVVGDYAQMPVWFDKLKEEIPEIAKLLENNEAEVNIVFPYYNGDVISKKGQTQVHKVGGEPVYVGEELWKQYCYDPQGLAEHLKDNPKQYAKLKSVAKSTIDWGMQKDVPVEMFEVVDHPQIEKLKAMTGDRVHIFMEYCPETAAMPVAYADGSYSSAPKTIKEALNDKVLSAEQLRAMSTEDVQKSIAGNFTPQGVPYMQWAKGGVKLAQEAGFTSGTYILSDSQPAIFSEIVAQLRREGDEFWSDVKITGVLHNVGPGYCGETSAKNLALAIMKPEQVKKVAASPKFKEACLQGREEDFWKFFVRGFIDDAGSINPDVGLILNADYVNTVSDGYYQSILANPEVSSVRTALQKKAKEGRAGGILNGLDTPGVDAHLPLPFPGYSKGSGAESIFLANDSLLNNVDYWKKTIIPYVTYPPRDTIDMNSMKIAKNHNKASLLRRFAFHLEESLAIAGVDGKKFETIGFIDPKYAENPEKTIVFTEWCRKDKQKASESVLESFIKFASTKEGENAVLIFGGAMDKTQPCNKKLLSLMESATKNPKLTGRIVYVNGFAPGTAFASGADFAVFASRFAPCELTDLEALKYYCTTIVSNNQGLAQKNFDPREFAESVVNGATSFKTHNGFYIPQDELDFIIKNFAEQDVTKLSKEDLAKLTESMHTVFPDSCGLDGTSMKRFVRFGEKYRELLAKSRKEFIGRVPETELEMAAKNSLLNSDSYKELVENFRDKIQVDELVVAMQRAARAYNDPELSQTLFENQKKLCTSWTNNGALNPDGKSSAYSYIKNHVLIDKVDSKDAQPLFVFDEEYLKEPGFTDLSGVKTGAGSAASASSATETVKQAANNAANDVKATVGANLNVNTGDVKNLNNASFAGGMKHFGTKLANSLKDKRVGMALAGVAAIGGFIVCLDLIDKYKGKKLAARAKALNTKDATPSASALPASNAPVSTAIPGNNGVSSDNKFMSHFA